VEQWLGVRLMLSNERLVILSLLPDDDLTRSKHVGVYGNVLKVFYVKLYVHSLVDKLK